jgi:hypothetical protein
MVSLSVPEKASTERRRKGTSTIFHFKAPSLYLRKPPPSGAEGTSTIFHFKEKDANEKANFGIDIEPDKKHENIRTFFERTGRLLVLCVPYLQGQHAVTMGAQGHGWPLL